ncbi:MAG: hypothetical protein JO170_02750 [Verrucomicrobia bacterium]|nr:hypothetical protein [Verrucomicrobiota bacterium]
MLEDADVSPEERWITTGGSDSLLGSSQQIEDEHDDEHEHKYDSPN